MLQEHFVIAENRVDKKISTLHADNQLLSEGTQYRYLEPDPPLQNILDPPLIKTVVSIAMRVQPINR